jgi:hypothetical protein
LPEATAPLRWLLTAALQLLLLFKPRPIDPRRIALRHVLLAAAAFLLALAALDYIRAEPPHALDPIGLLSLLGATLMVALAGGLVAMCSGRPALRASATSLLLLTLAVQVHVLHALHLWLQPDWRWLAAAGGAWVLLVVRRMLDGLDPRSHAWKRGATALAASALVLLALLVLPRWPLIDTAWEWEEDTEHASWPSFDAEALIYQQHARIDAALSTLAPQRPGVTDLYFLAFGADGSERVFAQEADYAARLMAQRFDGEGRTLVLGNDLRAPGERPLATLGNLRLALQGIARIMDPDEDVLFLFLTTHGSRDHELYVHLPPLPLTQIGPKDLRQALDDAGIRWRVLLVSACYSGGFIDVLGDATTLVMTAARADRSSFGCGPDSEITWFGRAYFAEALNRTSDLIAAFDIARDLIAQWEQDEDHEASHPQIRSTPLIAARLQSWTESVSPGPPLAFDLATANAADGSGGEADELEFQER